MHPVLQYAQRGWYVFPIAPGTKVPPEGFAWKARSTNNVAALEKALVDPRYRDCNWAVDCGKSGLFVVDADEGIKKGRLREGLKTLSGKPVLTTPFTVKTPLGGVHYYYTGTLPSTGPKSHNKIGEDVDTRGIGGYVLIPGSFAEGGYYTAISEGPVPEAPEWVKMHFASKPNTEIRKTEALIHEDKPAHLAKAVQYLINEAPEAIEGQGGDSCTYQVAARLRDLGVTEGKALDLMADFWNPLKAYPPWDYDDLRKKIEHAYRYAQNSPGCDTPEAQFPVHTLMKIRRGSDVRMEDLKPYDWIMKGRYLPGYYTVTIAPGGAGKSRLVLAEAISIVTGAQLTHNEVIKTGPVYLYTAEDPYEEIDRRIGAVRKHFGITSEQLKDLYFQSGYDEPICFAKQGERGSVIVNEPLVSAMIERIKALKCILVILDPMVELHELPENESKMAVMVQVFRRISKESGAALSIVHHTKKGITEAGDMDSARGSSTLVYGARLAHTLLTMTEKEGKTFGITNGKHKWYSRIDNAKGNYVAPAEQCDWYRKHSISVFGAKSDQTVGTLERTELQAVKEMDPEDLIKNRVFEILQTGEPKSLNYVAKIVKEDGLIKGSKTTIYNTIEEIFLNPVAYGAEVIQIELQQDASGNPVKTLAKNFMMEGGLF